MERPYYRRYPRVPADFPVEVTLGTAPLRARALSLGGGGLFLGIAQPFLPGTEMAVRFRPARHLPVISARSTVRHQIPEKGIGIEFTSIDPKHQEMILRLIHHRLAEQRNYPRAPLATQVEYEGGTLIGFSKDISAGGMFIETDRPLPVGSRLKLLFHLEEHGDVVKAEAEVLYAVAKLGIGVRFVNLSRDARHRIEAFAAKTID